MVHFHRFHFIDQITNMCRKYVSKLQICVENPWPICVSDEDICIGKQGSDTVRQTVITRIANDQTITLSLK